MPIEEVIAKYEASEDGENVTETESSEENNSSKPKVLKNPLIANLAGSSASKEVSPFLRAKASPIDKNGIKDESVTKQIDFNTETTPSDISNGVSSTNQLNSAESSKEELDNDISKEKINGEHPMLSTSIEDNSTSDSPLKSEIENKTSDKSEHIHDSNDLTKDVSSKQSNGNGPIEESKEVLVDGTQGENKVRSLKFMCIRHML